MMNYYLQKGILMLDIKVYVETFKLVLKGKITFVCFYMIMFKGFDGFTCTATSCKVCGDRIIPMNNQTSVNYCEICLV